MPEPLQIVIAEDNYLVREGTRRLLEDSGEVVVVAAVGPPLSCSTRSGGSSPTPSSPTSGCRPGHRTWRASTRPTRSAQHTRVSEW